MNLIEQYPEANSFTIPGKNEVILMIHGFTSSPYVFRMLAKHLSKKYGVEVRVPLLPGHGTIYTKLDDMTVKDWLEAAEKEFLELTKRFSKVHVMGMSMGGTLCAHLATRFPDLIETMTLFSPAMYVADFWSSLVIPFLHLLPEKKLRTILFKKKQDLNTDQYSYQTYSTKSIVVFQSLCQYVRKEFHCDVPTRIFVSQKDDVIHPRSGEWFIKRCENPNSKLIKLRRSPHILFMGSENEIILNELDRFLESTI